MGAVMEMDVMMVRLLRTEEGLWDYVLVFGGGGGCLELNKCMGI